MLKLLKWAVILEMKFFSILKLKCSISNEGYFTESSI